MRWPGLAGALLVTAVAINGAWIIRNYVIYDRFMPTRGNFGLELATAYHDGAVKPGDPRADFHDRMREVHPFRRSAGADRYRGFARDVDYFDAVGAETKRWIAENRMDAAIIYVRHIKEQFFPPLWLFDVYGKGSPSIAHRFNQLVAWTSGFLGLLMVAVGLKTDPRRYLLLVAMFLPGILLYGLVQPTMRYRYIMHPMLVYLACGMAALLIRQIAQRFGIRRESPAA